VSASGDWQDLCRGPHCNHTAKSPATRSNLSSIAGDLTARPNSVNRRDARNGLRRGLFTGKEKLTKRTLNDARTEAAKRGPPQLGARWTCSTMQEEAAGPDPF